MSVDCDAGGVWRALPQTGAPNEWKRTQI